MRKCLPFCLWRLGRESIKVYSTCSYDSKSVLCPHIYVFMKKGLHKLDNWFILSEKKSQPNKKNWVAYGTQLRVGSYVWIYPVDIWLMANKQTKQQKKTPYVQIVKIKGNLSWLGYSRFCFVCMWIYLNSCEWFPVNERTNSILHL